MAGICGIVQYNSEAPIDRVYLSAMTRELSMSRVDHGELVSDGSVGVGIQPFAGRLTGVACERVRDRQHLLAFHGNVYSREDLGLPKAGHADLVSNLLSLYSAKGMEFLKLIR